ncbi:SCO4225 family membrane protein [Streptomyces sp. NPDC015492]|uniref:SCO4225 family membrane protein n=1 Tax=Streptomyces sp. NPDC015492 TaxID=3364958 RepID=UPI0036F7C315
MRDSRPRAAARLTFANPLSLGYLALVASLPLLVSPWTEGRAFADFWYALATAPSSPVLLLPDLLTGLSGWATAYHYTALALSALINAFLLGLAHRALRKSPARQGLTA